MKASAKIVCSPLFWGLGALIVVSVYLLLWWNKALGGTTEGWFQHFANLMMQGQMPYRDFYLFTPPGHLLETAAVSRLMGTDFIDFRIFGFVQRLAICGMLYMWLARLFHPFAAFVGAVFCLFVYSGDQPDVLFYAHHSTAFWSLLACWAASHLDIKSRLWIVWILCAGLAAGLNFCVKQTTGLGVTLLIPTAWVLMAWKSDYWQRLKPAILTFAGAWVVPVLCVGLWLYANGAMAAFVEQTFLKGTNAKGPLLDVLLRPFTPWPVAAVYLLMMGSICLISLGLRQNSKTPEETAGPAEWLRLSLVPAFAMLLVIAAGYWLGRGLWTLFPNNETFTMLRLNDMFLIACAFPASTVFACLYCPLWIRKEENRPVFFMASIGMGMALFYAISFVLYNPMVLPGLGLLVAYLTHLLFKSAVSTPAKRRPFYLFMLALLLQMAVLITARLLIPFDFYGWREPAVYAKRSEPSLPQLQGLDLSAQTNSSVARMVELIQQNSGKKETLFVFPHFPMLYTLADRSPATFAQVHWFDVCPDYMAREDMERLRKNPPKIMMIMSFSDENMTMMEGLYRGGKKSGQRDMMHFLEESTSGYTLLAEFSGYPYLLPIRMWVRNP